MPLTHTTVAPRSASSSCSPTATRSARSASTSTDVPPGSPRVDGRPCSARPRASCAGYADGVRETFDLPLRPRFGGAFERRVWAHVAAIPYGTTTTYGEIAAALDAPGSARAVGAANGRNPLPLVVPCHRVIGARGALTGYAGGLEQQAPPARARRRAAGDDWLGVRPRQKVAKSSRSRCGARPRDEMAKSLRGLTPLVWWGRSGARVSILERSPMSYEPSLP